MGKLIKRPTELVVSSVLIVVCCAAELYGLTPFGAPMFCALVPFAFFGVIAPVYIVCSFLFTFEVWRLYLSGAVVVISAVRWFVGLKAPKLDRDAARILFSLGAIFVETVLCGLFRPIYDALLGGLIAAVFYYFARYAALAVSRRFAFRPSATEGAAACVVLFAAGLAFGRAVVGAYYIGLIPAMLAAVVLCAVGAKASLAGGFSTAVGLGLSLGLETAFAFAAAAAVMSAFRVFPRPLYALVGLGTFAALAVLFGIEPTSVGLSTAMLACGALPYCILPPRTARALCEYFDFDGSARLAVRHYVNKTRADAGDKMLLLSSVFDETARLMNAIAPPQPDTAALGRMLSDRFCPYCPNSGDCDLAAAAVAFEKVAAIAQSGRAVITDMPEFFNTCRRTADVIGAAAEMTEAAKERAARTESDERAKATVVERLTAVKDVLGDLGAKQALPVGFDGDAERKVKTELCERGIECAEAFVTKSGVTAIVRTAAADREKIRRAVSVALKCACEVSALERTSAAGWSVASLKKRPRYEAVYARAGVARSGVSGDSYTFERIGDRFLVALADGMGSGAAAGADSDAALELIECFYRAGFDSASALSGVNKFLKLPRGVESYSAADVAVCDLDTACVDIIKLGSPPCYIKTTDTVLKIEGSSLPIGVLDEMRPFVAAKRLYPGQMLILVSDGVADCFSGDGLPEFINGIPGHNPEAAARDILARALDRIGGEPRDDMTVVAFRLFEPTKRLGERSDGVLI